MKIRSEKAGQRRKQGAREREFRVLCFKVYGEHASDRLGEIAGGKHCGVLEA